MSSEISAAVVYAQIGLPGSALIIDVRSDADCSALPRLIPGALRRDPERLDEWARTLPHAPAVITYRQRDDEVGGLVNARLTQLGYAAHQLTGGIEGWMAAGHATARIRAELKSPGASRWVTRERPKIDRLACPWLIRRFIDAEAQFFYTPPQRVRAEAKSLGAEPYDITDVTFSHRGPRCSFDAFLDEFDLHDPVLDQIATIVRAADTDTLEQSREAAGLLAISLGLSATIADDILLLEQAVPLYDALYAWRKKASHETHGWPQPQATA
jgi:rhodanese-related sulfurtransferase